MTSALNVLQTMPSTSTCQQNHTQAMPGWRAPGPWPAWAAARPAGAARPGTAWVGRRLFALLILLLTLLGGCAHLPAPVPREPTLALPASTATPLGRIAADSSPDEALSGFRLLPIGAFAIDTRLTLIRRAVRSIDVQYYLIQDDETGRFLLRSLRDAALRGVRVRLLMDDLYTSGSDPVLLGLAAQPNVEIRLFNPFPGGRDYFLTRFPGLGA